MDTDRDKLARALLQDPWAWRNDMSAPVPGYPEMRNSQVRNPTDNMRPMAYDALSAMGVPHPDAQHYAQKIGAAAPWTPPGFMVDAAAGIGGPLHEGKPLEAAGNAYLLYLTGKLGQKMGQAFLPPIGQAARDQGRAKLLEALYPNEHVPPAAGPFTWSLKPGMQRQDRLGHWETGGTEYYAPRAQTVERAYGPMANINDRKNFKRALEVLE